MAKSTNTVSLYERLGLLHVSFYLVQRAQASFHLPYLSIHTQPHLNQYLRLGKMAQEYFLPCLHLAYFIVLAIFVYRIFAHFFPGPLCL
jgi:hypothetical protein